MPESKVTHQELTKFGRSFNLLFNRAAMYDPNHPYCEQAIDAFVPIAQVILTSHSPLVFIMNQERFFIDDEPLDSRINVSRMVAHFKKTEVQSVSFYDGIDINETRAFVEIFTTLKKYPHVRAMQIGLETSGVSHIRLNHVYFKKVSTDEEIVTREDLEKMPGEVVEAAQMSSKKMFMDMILESVLTEEFEKNISMAHITENPAQVSQNMIDADLATYSQSDAEDKQPGLVLLHQLQMLGKEVEAHLSGIPKGMGEGKAGSIGGGEGTGISLGQGEGEGGDGSPELSELAVAVFDIKRQLVDGIALQKALGTSYPNEVEILEQANEITDNVLIRLIKDEYRSGQISSARLAQILKRLVPNPKELKRIMPKIKKALLEEGMPLSDYLTLVQELSNELQDEELSKILLESAESVGLDGVDLIQEIKNNPVQAAELIFLAAEIRKGTGDDNVLTDLLVDYVERLGPKLALDIAKQDNQEGEQHLRRVLGSVESQIVGRLRDMDVNNDILDRLEEKLNSRLDQLFEDLKEKWAALQPSRPEQGSQTDLSVLQILEQSASESEELGAILRMVRTEAQSKGLDENDFKNILDEITKQKERKQKAKEVLPVEVLDSERLMFFLEKEISRSLRYELPFATLSFSVVSAKAKAKDLTITQESLIEAVLMKLVSGIRGADLAARLGKNKVVALLPMTPEDEARLALRRHLRLFNKDPIEVNGVPITIQVAGVSTNFDPDKTPNARAFIETLSLELSEMVNRIKNIHGLA